MQFSSDLERQLNGYGLTHRAHPPIAFLIFESVLQTYVWQDYDRHPIFLRCTGSWISGSPGLKARSILSAIRISA